MENGEIIENFLCIVPHNEVLKRSINIIKIK